MLRIVHVSGDFPDPIEPFKTPVIRNLLDITADRFDHQVFSLNRVTPNFGRFVASAINGLGTPRLKVDDQTFAQGTAVRYLAPPRGFFHATMLKQLGDWLAGQIARSNAPTLALIAGHKLAIEGIAVRRAAERLGLPYALSIQGDTDTKILETRPDLHGELRRVFHGAAMVFPFAPWALRRVEEKLGTRAGPVTVLPCPTDLDLPDEPRIGGAGLISVFHLKNRKRKNLPGMITALQLLQSHGLSTQLSVIGGGNEHDLVECRTMIGSLASVKLEGPMDRPQLQARMRNAIGFVMPSLRESFGLVFIEALFCGLPIVYPAGTAVDGFVDGLPFAIKVDALDPRSIALGMRRLVIDEALLKRELAIWLNGFEAQRFTRPAIANAFSTGLLKALAGGD